MKCNIIGAGRLGKNIARAISSTQTTSLQGICNRSLDSAIKACHEIGAGTAVTHIEELASADVTWITSNDDSIPPIVNALSQLSLKPGSLIVHCSGVLNSTLLAPLKEQGCAIASFHPLKAFKSGYLADNAFKGVDCVLEGDVNACKWLKSCFEPLEAHLITIKPEAKTIYHAAATIASNYLITLASSSEELLLQAGMSREHARRMISNLMQGNINNIQQTPHIADALTGPLMRGDTNTLSLHLNAIENTQLRELYKAAGLATLPLTHLSEHKREAIQKILKK